MSAINITVPVDSEIEAQAQEVFTSLGLDITTAINIFLRQAIQRHGLPFDVVAEPVQKRSREVGWEPDPTKTPKPGCMKGEIWMSDDFNDPCVLITETELAQLKKGIIPDSLKDEPGTATKFDAPLDPVAKTA